MLRRRRKSMWAKFMRLTVLTVAVLAFALGVVAQAPTPDSGVDNGTRDGKKVAGTMPESVPGVSTGATEDFRHGSQSEEEAAILPYYNNYLREYHLGPEDVISVEVFGQANYSKSGIVVPPT